MQKTETKSKAHQKVAGVLDDAFTIPGTKVKIGLDPIIGLVPGVGDIIGGLIGLYFLWEGSRRKLPVVVILRMGFNILLEVAIGSIPILGDLFDVSWKANRRNSELIDKYEDHQKETTIVSTIIVWVVFIVLGAIILGVLAGIIALIDLFFDRLFGEY
jgi:hypothetical protein